MTEAHSSFRPTIKRRDLHFSQQSIPRYWLDDSCHLTRLFDALSLFFPEGERFFIESLRHYRDQVPADSALAGEIRAFIGQEAMHSREHRDYNQRLAAQGIGAVELEAETLRNLNLARDKASPAQQLAMTLCLEHFTAILADVVLSDDSILDRAHPAMRQMWRWHALEETEHKAVAFDLYRHVFGDGWRAYLRRCWLMLSVSFYFTVHVWTYLIRIIRRDGHGSDWRGWRRLLGFMFGTPGPFRRIIPAWADWFKPSFHPWQHDNRRLLARVQAEYDIATAS